MDLVTLAAAKKYTRESLEGKGAVKGKDGVSVSSLAVNSEKHLVATMSDGSTKDAGEVPTVKGDKGDAGEAGAKGDKGDIGEKGDDGFSPEITVAQETETAYKLHIKTAGAEFDTPNLKGIGGGTATPIAIADIDALFD